MSTKQKLIYVASPLRGDMEGNIRKANAYCCWAAKQGVIPVASHLMFTGFLDDNIPEERDVGRKLGIELLKHCDGMWVFGDVISKGMQAELDWARVLNIPVRYIPERVVEHAGMVRPEARNPD